MDDTAPRIFTGRLELIAATAVLAEAALGPKTTLAAILETGVPAEWPPVAVADLGRTWATALGRDPSLTGWLSWFIIQVAPPLLVGVIVIGGRPDHHGVVECSYSLLPKFERRGYATEALGGLIDWAFAHPEVREIAAETLPHLVTTARVFAKNGLSHVGSGAAPGSLRFALRRR